VYKRRATVERCRDGGQQHRLLGVGRAAHAAVTEVPATLDVALDDPDRDGELLATGHQHLIVRVRRRIPGAHPQLVLHHREPGAHRLGAELPQAELALPEVEDLGRRAEAAGPVDRRRTADAAPLQNVDRLVGRLARSRFLIQLGIGVGFAHLEVARRAQRPFFDEDDAQTGVAEDVGSNTAAGAGADDDHIELVRLAPGERRCVNVLPAGSQPGLDRIEHQKYPFGGPG
jgi:hypothetical protein